MNTAPGNGAWVAYALNGRPDFLNYLQRGDVTWSGLWQFYREQPADPDAAVRLMGFFHAFLSHDFDAEGSVLDEDGRVYPPLREWAQFVVDAEEYVPEEKIRESLAGLLGKSMISPLYYEAAFNVYLEATVERDAAVWTSAREGADDVERLETAAGPRRLTVRLPQLTRYAAMGEGPGRRDAVSALVARHYSPWNSAYALALGGEADDWMDDGGGG